MLGVGQSIFDIFYPIGTYYETSNPNFNPNTAYSWYGTWVEDTEGQVLVSRNSGTFATVGANIGEEKHLLTINEMPPHDHQLPWYTNQGNSRGFNGWNDSTRYDGSCITSNTGGNQPHNNIQPSKVIIRWHRIA